MLPRWFTCPQMVTHWSTNRAQCRLTTLIELNALTTTLQLLVGFSVIPKYMTLNVIVLCPESLLHFTLYSGLGPLGVGVKYLTRCLLTDLVMCGRRGLPLSQLYFATLCLSLQRKCITDSVAHLPSHTCTCSVYCYHYVGSDRNCDVLVCVKYVIWLVLSSTYLFLTHALLQSAHKDQQESRSVAEKPHVRCRYTRSSATAEKQRVSCACLPRLANWSCNAQNTAEPQRLYCF